MVKEKQDWRSPITSYQEFVPQEFITACQILGWKAYGNMMITTLYHDDNRNGRYDSGLIIIGNEEVNVASGAVPRGASADPNSGYIDGDLPNNINDGYYYLKYSGRQDTYNDKVVGQLYRYRPNWLSSYYYFTSYEKVSNLS